MAKGNSYELAIEVNLGAAQSNIAPVKENARLTEDYIVPSDVESQTSIVYPAFDQAKFHLQIDDINMFQNALQFFRRATKNPNAHISRFLDMGATFEYPEV